VFGECRGGKSDKWNAFVSRSEQHVEFDVGCGDCGRVISSESRGRVTRVEKSRVEKIRTHTAGFKREFAKAQHAEFECEVNEFSLIGLHGLVFLYDGRLRFARRSMTRSTAGRNRLFRVISLNANGIRAAARKGFFEWLQRQDADVVCIQETKAQVHQLGDKSFSPAGYHCYYEDAVKKGYSGVAIYSKHKPKKVVRGYGDREFDDEGRYLEVQLGGISVVSLYLPSGSSGDERQEAKYRCMGSFTEHLHKLRRKRSEYIICGDWNIAHKEVDLKNWRANRKNSGFLPEERAWMDKVFGEYKYVDGFRTLEQEPHEYTWWSNRGRAWDNNVGWRLDYQVVTKGLEGKVLRTEIYKDERFSDHAPLIMDYDWVHDD